MHSFDYVECEKNADGVKLCPNCGVPYHRWEFGRNEPDEVYLYFRCGLILYSVFHNDINIHTNQVIRACAEPTSVFKMTADDLREHVHQLIRNSYAS